MLWVIDSETGKPAAECVDYKAARDFCIANNTHGGKSRYYIDRNYNPNDPAPDAKAPPEGGAR